MAITKVTRGKGGKVLQPGQLQPALDESLKELAAIIKEYIIKTAESAGKHKFKKDGKGFVEKTTVGFTEDGISIELPAYAQTLEGLRDVDRR